MPDCSICLEPILEEVAPLTGCTHTFHPECIIPYFRTSASNGRCPECRRNPFQTDEPQQDEFEEPEDEGELDFIALDRIRKLQRHTAIASNNPTIKRKVQNINSRIKAAREARKQAVEIQKKFKASREYSKMKADLARHQKDVRTKKIRSDEIVERNKEKSKSKTICC